jgi:hypothetical protein
LESYDDELKVRGAQPILGILKDIAAIVEADLGASGAKQEWLAEGLQEAFQRFANNHAQFVMHFPLDPDREELYWRLSVDESASGPALSVPFETVATAALDANKAGLTTDDFLKIVDKLAEFAKVTSTLPLSTPAPTPTAKEILDSYVRMHEGRISSPTPPVSAKKRVLLTGFGFFERLYSLAGSTASIAETEQGRALLAALQQAITFLSKLIGFT